MARRRPVSAAADVEAALGDSDIGRNGKRERQK